MAGWSRVRLVFAPGVEVLFADRDRALSFFEEVAERGTRFPLIIYGPEGCGKTALLRQVFEILRARGYSVAMVSPLEGGREEAFRLTSDLVELAASVIEAVLGVSVSALADVLLRIAVTALRRGHRRVAVLVDDVFQAIGLNRVEAYVKSLLNLIEYPPAEYERIVVVVASSEGVSLSRVGRHDWAEVMGLWNMGRSGFEELYNQLPPPKPGFDDVWRLTGGNPRLLSRLYTVGWDQRRVVEAMARVRSLRELIAQLTPYQRHLLASALEDPDSLTEAIGSATERERMEARRLLDLLVEANLVIRLWGREYGWIDEPPPRRDPELGVGETLAWQTPLHREAVRLALSG